MDVIGHGGCAVCRLAYEILVGGRLHRGNRVSSRTFDKIVESRRFVSYGDIYKFRAFGQNQRGRTARGEAVKGRREQPFH